MSSDLSQARVSSWVERIGVGVGVGVGVSGLACSLPSAKIEPPQTPSSDHEQATQASAKRAGRFAKATRKAAAPGRGPTVIEAELLGEGERLRLHFSEPLASTDRVDPSDFRLSVALAYAYKMYAYAYYYDAGLVDGRAKRMDP